MSLSEVRCNSTRPNTACSRPRFARGQRLGLAKLRAVRASLPRGVRAAADAHVRRAGSNTGITEE